MRRRSIFHLFGAQNVLTIRRMAAREIRVRIVGTMLGFAHYFITPLFYLAIYTWLFSTVFKARWGSGGGSHGDFALRVYAGLIVFQFFSEVIGRAPRLILENPSYVTKIAFPLETLVPSAMTTAFFVVGVNYSILLAGHVFLVGAPQPAALALLIIWPAFLLFVGGLAWLLAALGVYLRDLSQFVTTVVPALMFVSPIFYPLTVLPQNLQGVLMLNPLAWFVEATRGALIDGVMPGPATFALLYGAGIAAALLGHGVFQRMKHGFADVV